MTLETVFNQMKSLTQDILRDARKDGEIPHGGEVYTFLEWPAKLTALPSVLLSVTGGNLPTQDGWQGPIQHEVSMLYYFPNITTAEGHAQITPMIERVKDKFAANLTLGDRVDNLMPVAPPARWYEGPGTLVYAGREHVGIIFNYLMKAKSSESIVQVSAGTT